MKTVSGRPLFACFAAIACALTVQAGVDEDWKELYNLALRAVASKDYARAETIYAKALHDAEIFGKEDVRVASTLQGQAWLLRLEKKSAEAEDATRRAMAIYAKSSGVESTEYAQLQLDLAGILTDEAK